MAKPSIKGSVFQGLITEILRLLDRGMLTEDDLAARLGTEALAYFETEIHAALWYPIETYARMMQLLGDLEGGGKDKYFIDRGRLTARRLMEGGLYGQLDFLTRWRESSEGESGDEPTTMARYKSSLKLVVSLASNIYNVGRWTVELDQDNPRRMWIAIREASSYSEPMRLAIEGFLNECGSKHTRTTQLYTSERADRDLILFRMNYDVMDLLGRLD